MMPEIGRRASLVILREKPVGLFLDAQELGEILLPRREMPVKWELGEMVDIFIYLDSEDRLVATLKNPKAMPGQFARLKCVATNAVGAFLDWGLAKDLLVPFREQKTRMVVGKSYLVRLLVDDLSQRIVATTRIARYLDLEPHRFATGDAVELIVFGKTPLGYKAIINGTHTGLLFANEVFQELSPGEKLPGFIAGVRADGKIDLSLRAQGRDHVDSLEQQVLAELSARGGFWDIGDHSPAEVIHEELGVSKRVFKQTLGALLKKKAIEIGEGGIRLV